MTSTVTVALAQIDLNVGDVVGNKAKILEYAARARDEMQADLVIFPELSVCGYPPEDLLFHAGLRKQTEQAVDEIRDSTRDTAILIGFPEYADGQIYNSCAVFRNGDLLCAYRMRRSEITPAATPTPPSVLSRSVRTPKAPKIPASVGQRSRTPPLVPTTPPLGT